MAIRQATRRVDTHTHNSSTATKCRALTEEETAKYISISRSTLRKARMTGTLLQRKQMPPFVKLGRSVRYLIDDLDQWLTNCRVNNTLGNKI